MADVKAQSITPERSPPYGTTEENQVLRREQDRTQEAIREIGTGAQAQGTLMIAPGATGKVFHGLQQVPPIVNVCPLIEPVTFSVTQRTDEFVEIKNGGAMEVEFVVTLFA